MDFSTAVQHILKYEGGLVDDPNDAGGITKYGISLRAYPELGRDGIVSLTVETAKEIYRNDYWEAIRAEDLPDYTRLIAFDCSVNQGVNYCKRTLQAASGAFVDGAIGPKTLQALHDCDPVSFLKRFSYLRANRYMSHKNFSIYGEGWMRRLLDVTICTRE